MIDPELEKALGDALHVLQELWCDEDEKRYPYHPEQLDKVHLNHLKISMEYIQKVRQLVERKAEVKMKRRYNNATR
jgi:hypothetical protein